MSGAPVLAQGGATVPCHERLVCASRTRVWQVLSRRAKGVRAALSGVATRSEVLEIRA